jgi:hypothetical protein
MAFRFAPGPLSAAAAAALNSLAAMAERAARLTAAAPLAISEAGGNKVLSINPAAVTAGLVAFVRPTNTRTSGRYPGYLQTYSVDANTWADVTSPAVWLVHPNGGELPSEVNSELTSTRVPCVYAGRLAADGLAVYLALAVPGFLTDWACVGGTTPRTYFDPDSGGRP